MINFDGIVGPTHNYSGLSWGNIASWNSKEKASNPQAAALQGLEKMWTLSQLGVMQAVLPPHERPHLPTLKSLGFKGIEEVPLSLLAQFSSASPMWTANMATMTPSSDTEDGKVHFTPANLQSKLHRFIEKETSYRLLKTIFSDERFFIVHPPLPSHPLFGDEGAANHTRFSGGIHLFVYGDQEKTKQFPARQTKEASESIIRRHQIKKGHFFVVEQNPTAIDAGVFHNDVISTGHENLFLVHEQAFVNTPHVLAELAAIVPQLTPIVITSEELPLEEAIHSYLFNSQIVTTKEGTRILIIPEESASLPVLKKLRPLFDQILPLNVRESMQNGGGPACLRLRIELTEEERKAIRPRLFLDRSLYEDLKKWILTHYRTHLTPHDLQDPSLYQESEKALQELSTLLDLPCWTR